MKLLRSSLAVVLVAFFGGTPPLIAEPSLLVDGEWLEANISDPELRIIDFRKSRLAYRIGHIPGARHLPRKAAFDTVDGTKGMLPPLETLADHLGDIGVLPEHRIVIYDDADALWAARLFWALEVVGHSRVHVLDGGMRGWKDQNRPVTRRKAEISVENYVAEPRESLVVDTSMMLGRLGSPETWIIDSRSPEEYAGKDKRARRVGHIPGALNIEWILNLEDGPGSRFLVEDDLPPVYHDIYSNPRPEIVTYCQAGVRASHTYFTLRLLGYSDVKVYDGSWEVWGNLDDTPIELP